MNLCHHKYIRIYIDPALVISISDRMWSIQNFEIWTRLNKIWHLLLGQYNCNLDYSSLFVKFMFIFILFDVVLIALLKVFRENNVSIFSHSLHTCLLANRIDISSGYSVWPGIRFKYISCIERKMWVNTAWINYYLTL